MNRTLSSPERAQLASFLDRIPEIQQGVDAIVQAGGRVFLVGGAVRDLLLDLPLKDIDLEVHGLSVEALTSLLKQFGTVNDVGKSFGVLKFRARGMEHPDIDWALPRTDSAGRKPQVAVDPAMTIEKALRRRDLTMNALAIDLSTLELHDPFGGEHDLGQNKLRCPDTKLFIEDPLRFYRVMQFIGRFGMLPDHELDALCARMDIADVSRERIDEEMKKLLLKSKSPSRAFRWLEKIGRLQELFPELAALRQTPQTAAYHPEGDVFEHTMQVLDAAADVRERIQDNDQKLILMYAALCHDLGKAATTVIREGGKITSYDHEVVGVDLTKKLLKRICGNKDLIAAAAKLVRFHMEPGNFLKGGAKQSAYKRLALKLAPETDCTMLANIMEADRRGRNPAKGIPLPAPAEGVAEFLQKVEQANVLHTPEPQVLMGADLLDVVKPGPALGRLLKQAYEIQINEGIKDKAELRRRVLGE